MYFHDNVSFKLLQKILKKKCCFNQNRYNRAIISPNGNKHIIHNIEKELIFDINNSFS